MTRSERVQKLIKECEETALEFARSSNHYMERAAELRLYLYELNKPGFKTKGWNRASKQGRIEPYLVTSGDTITD